ncbi:DUF3489 domain-containing protein [Pseudogemmobacter sp. W21_MBD1_M6]|uniref:DUF3489 domain-containing protein n=1 Tax=Pseudogemmobacter sp. W21_MBD1_M6 TaxID=3240271 RepID=UPI003F9568DE
MSNLTKTQSLILTTGAQRADNIAMPLPEGLHGAAAKKVVTMMIDCGWLEEVDANTRKGEPLWRETGDGHGTTLVVTDAGLLAVGTEPVVVKTMAAVREHAAAAVIPKTPSLRTGTKQAQIINLLQRPEGASIAEIVAMTGWLPHSIRGLISGGLKKKLGLPVTSAKVENRGTVYRIA